MQQLHSSEGRGTSAIHRSWYRPSGTGRRCSSTSWAKTSPTRQRVVPVRVAARRVLRTTAKRRSAPHICVLGAQLAQAARSREGARRARVRAARRSRGHGRCLPGAAFLPRRPNLTPTCSASAPPMVYDFDDAPGPRDTDEKVLAAKCASLYALSRIELTRVSGGYITTAKAVAISREVERLCHELAVDVIRLLSTRAVPADGQGSATTLSS